MKLNRNYIFTLFFLLLVTASSLNAQNDQSVYPDKPKDPQAVYLTSENFEVAADGIGDDAPALQAAIDLVLEQSRQGIVFIPEGTYRLGKTVRLWSGIRLIGYGAQRPTFTLVENSPGFQEGEHKYMVHFCHSPGGNHPPQPGTWQTPEFVDGTWGTFYSGIDNINFEIERGNPAAIAVRYHVAQVCALKNIDFNIGDGRGAVEEMGNIIENCMFRGGEYGIKTNPSPPDWQVMVLDCAFEGQREASIITDRARMLVIRSRFKHAPVGIFVPDSEKLYVKDSWFEDMSNSAMVIKNFAKPELQLNLENLKLSHTPYSVRISGRAQGWSKEEMKTDYEAPSAIYTLESFSHGLHIEMKNGIKGKVDFTTKMEQAAIERMGEFTTSDVPVLPPQDTWVNILDLGAKGDGITDCTGILEKAIANHDVIYFPIGKYLVSNTLELGDNTILIGLHPSRTQLVLNEDTPGFMDADNARPLILASKGASCGISGVGFSFDNNPGLIGIKWMAGANSYINDMLYNGRSNPSQHGKGQMHALWITDGGGGVFKNIWINDRKPKMAFFVNNTETTAKIYEISVEHHQEVEVRLDNVKNWSFYALQLEEDRGSEKTLGIYMVDCRNILFANLVSHRTSGVWEPYFTGIQLRHSKDIYFRGMEMRGRIFPFTNTLFDEVSGNVISRGYFTKLDIK